MWIKGVGQTTSLIFQSWQFRRSIRPCNAIATLVDPKAFICYDDYRGRMVKLLRNRQIPVRRSVIKRICAVLKRAGTIIFAILLTINSAACSVKKTSRYEAEFLVLFDTMTKIVTYTDSKEEFTRQSQFIYDELKEYHELYDIYNDYEGINNIKTINDQAGIAPVKVDRRIIDLILFARDWYEKTDGKMNVAFGAVLRIWHDFRTAGIDDPDNARLPPMEQLEAASKHTDISKIVINEEKSTVFLEDPEMSLDVGAVAKGYAAEQVKRMAEENGFTSGLISVGGNVCAIGTKGETGSPWNVGIQNPDPESEQANIKIVNLNGYSLVTSGNYERFYTVNEKNYHHIIDPETLFPSEYFASVTIICRDSGIADVLSTAVFNMPFERGYEFIEGLQDTEALWVTSGGEIKYSLHFQDFINK